LISSARFEFHQSVCGVSTGPAADAAVVRSTFQISMYI
jgi:hypothetical protein